MGRDGPNAAGRAKKAVEFSCVSVMIAFGGKRENGARKEKNACMPVFGAGVAVDIVCFEWEDRKERNVRKTAVTRKATAMRTLGGRMMYEG